MSVKMKIVVPTYNTEHWIQRCIRSIAAQSYKNFECVIINDCSTDKTGHMIDQCKEIQDDPRFKIVHNKENVKALKNIVDGFNVLNAKNDPECVLMVIDGDDFLYSSESLLVVAQYYSQFNPLLTYGNWVGWPHGSQSNNRPIPKHVHNVRNYRDLPFAFSHLRTFKSKLWYNIKDEDLKGPDGKYFESGWDVAFMLPMIEMAGQRTIMIPNVLYCYNMVNPISDSRVRGEQQISIDNYVRTKKPYNLYKG